MKGPKHFVGKKLLIRLLMGGILFTSPLFFPSHGHAKIKMIDNTLYDDWLYNPRTYDRERYYLRRMKEIREKEVLDRIRAERLALQSPESKKKAKKEEDTEIHVPSFVKPPQRRVKELR